MWHSISTQISQQLNIQFDCQHVQQLHGGDSHTAFHISDNTHHFFVKTNHKLTHEQFQQEQEGLLHIKQSGVRVPQVVCNGTTSDKSYLVLEYLDLKQGSHSDWFAFGQALANMHQNHTQQMYGWQEDNHIGTTPQPNKWYKKWACFFAEQRIGYLLQLLHEKKVLISNIDNAVEAIKNLLAGHQPQSSLLHGDLWAGNVGFMQGEAVLYDPAIYFGDRETDIAMTELFNRFPEHFYQGYQSIWPLDQGYEYRKSVYQLYHVLNHGLLFGGHYIDSARTLLKSLDN